MIKRFNKKGFTLIELLAVIVVLAIIMLLAVQAVLPQMEKARKNAFVVEANAAIEAAQTWKMTEILNGDSSKNCVTIKKLIDAGYYDANENKYSGYVQISGGGSGDETAKYDYTVYLTNGSNYSVSGVKGENATDHKPGKVSAKDVNNNTTIGDIPGDCVGKTNN